jgi:citrate lyase subunit beta-like protein
MRARRALLYVPGNRLDLIKKAIEEEVDSICIDLEFGVPLNQKVDSRNNIVYALNNLDFGGSERLVRINPVRTDLAENDLRTVLSCKPDGIVLPEVDAPERLQWVNRIMTSIEEENKWESGTFNLHAMIETAQAMINLPRICEASERLVSLVFGADDLIMDLGATRTKAGWEVFHYRNLVNLYATAYGLQAIDMSYPFIDDPTGLRHEAQLAAEMGYDGKQVIHEDQIEIVQEVFTPSEEAIRLARGLLYEFTSQQEQVSGAFTSEGKLIDMPMVKSTLRILERARAAKKLK